MPVFSHRRRPRARARRALAAHLPYLRHSAALLVAILLSACSPFGRTAPPAPVAVTAPPQATRAAQGAQIAALAVALIGRPYEFGGADEGGFDCSGLALYVHERAGISIPRTAAEQQRAAQPVALARLAPGDLVFFRLRARHVDHVGVYAGEGRFIHAPHSGVAVASADLSDAFYSRHIASAGRFWSATVSPP